MKTPGPGQNPILSAEEISKAPIENIIRLAKWLGIDCSGIVSKPNAKWRLACAIVRWNKRNPQPKYKK